MVAKESQVRMIGYGAMLMESFVAISALIAACVIDPGLYFAINSPLGATGGDPATAVGVRHATSASRSARTRSPRPPQSVEEATLISRTGGAPTLAFGMSSIFSDAFGGGLAAFWYHFAIMFEALFILTAVDAGTRVGRFMLQDTVGNFWPRYGDLSWKPASWSASAIVVGLWGYMLYVGVTDPLGGINQLFPLFGISNQLLAAIALTLCVTLLIKHGKAEVGLGARHRAGLGPHRHDDRELPEGVLRQPEDRLLRPAVDRTRTPSTRASVLPPATDMDQMQQIVTNSTAQRHPAGDRSRSWSSSSSSTRFVICIKAVRAGSLPTTEVPAAPSTLVAPSDFFATAEEKEAVREWEASRRLRRPGARDEGRRAPRRPGAALVRPPGLRRGQVGRVRRAPAARGATYPMSRREFERHRADHRERNPQSRCC